MRKITAIRIDVLLLILISLGLAFGIGYVIGKRKEIKVITVPTVAVQTVPQTEVTPPTQVEITPAPPAETTPPISANVNMAPTLPPLELCFSPQQNCESIIVETIQKAQESIYIQAYSFTSQPIIHALQMAQKRGVQIQIILDAKTKAPPYVYQSGLPIYMERMPGLAHNKVMIIDGKTVLTGSYNFTKAAKHRNAENLIKIEAPEVAQQYMTNWQMHFKRAQQIAA